MGFKERLKQWPKEDLLRESRNIRKKRPSSYNWSVSDRKQILSEVERRKKSGKISKSAGKTKRKSTKGYSFGFGMF